MSYESLIREHARIDVALDRLQALTAMAVPDVPAVVIGLSDLSRELADHLSHEDSFIYPRMIAGADPDMVRIAQAFVTEFADLTHDWQIYLGEWNSECIAADWDSFVLETEVMARRLAARVRAETELLYSAALKSNAIQLRDRRPAS